MINRDQKMGEKGKKVCLTKDHRHINKKWKSFLYEGNLSDVKTLWKLFPSSAIFCRSLWNIRKLKRLSKVKSLVSWGKKFLKMAESILVIKTYQRHKASNESSCQIIYVVGFILKKLNNYFMCSTVYLVLFQRVSSRQTIVEFNAQTPFNSPWFRCKNGS